MKEYIFYPRKKETAPAGAPGAPLQEQGGRQQRRGRVGSLVTDSFVTGNRFGVLADETLM